MWKLVNFIAAVLAAAGSVTMAFVDLKMDQAEKKASKETESEDYTDDDEEES